MSNHSLPQQTIALAFEHLKNDVHIAVRTQVGDAARLDQHITLCNDLEMHIENVYFVLLFCCPNCLIYISIPM